MVKNVVEGNQEWDAVERILTDETGIMVEQTGGHRADRGERFCLSMFHGQSKLESLKCSSKQSHG